ncbi:MAG: DUF115 domain-containing protein [Chloroflexi bacterium]|nr:DUF115 domain-containing protein [Chloroflexota bacterium]
MASLAKTVARYLPRWAVPWVRAAYLKALWLPQWPAATFHPWRRASIRRLAALKDRYRGQRAFILGNGPSLRRTPVHLLRDEFTFGLNRVYLAFPEWGFRTRFLVAVNDLVIEQCAADLRALDMPKFVTWRARRWLPLDPHTTFLFTTYMDPTFATDARGRLWEGATVTYVALQLAFHMGFDPVILVGVDHSFKTQGPANQTVVSQGDDPNHFLPHYFGRGFRWQLPDLETSEYAYRLAREAYERAGRQVLDATIGGQLQVFPKVAFENLF